MSLQLEGKTIVVTGAASGIGERTARELRAAGAVVIGVDRNPSPQADRQILADLSNPDGVWNIWVVDADGGNARPMFEAGALQGIVFEYNNVDERVLSWS